MRRKCLLAGVTDIIAAFSVEKLQKIKGVESEGFREL